MKIELTKEQADKFIQDGYMEVGYQDIFTSYIEIGRELGLTYFEYKAQVDKRRKVVCADNNDFRKIQKDYIYYGQYSSDDPRCPNCLEHMIYQFNYCPKCGQALNWNEEK